MAYGPRALCLVVRRTVRGTSKEDSKEKKNAKFGAFAITGW